MQFTTYESNSELQHETNKVEIKNDSQLFVQKDFPQIELLTLSTINIILSFCPYK